MEEKTKFKGYTLVLYAVLLAVLTVFFIYFAKVLGLNKDSITVVKLSLKKIVGVLGVLAVPLLSALGSVFLRTKKFVFLYETEERIVESAKKDGVFYEKRFKEGSLPDFVYKNQKIINITSIILALIAGFSSVAAIPFGSFSESFEPLALTLLKVMLLVLFTGTVFLLRALFEDDVEHLLCNKYY